MNNELLLRMASSLARMELDTTYKVYENGSVIMDNENIALESFDQKHKLHNGLFLYNNSASVSAVLIACDMELGDAHKKYINDMTSKKIIFDSSADNIIMYETVMYIFVNNELKMGKGKTCSQVAHVVREIVEKCINDNDKNYKYWKDSFTKTVVCGATLNQLNELKNMKNSFYTVDAGLTQIPSNSLTTVGFMPLQVKNLPQKFKDYKLLN